MTNPPTLYISQRYLTMVQTILHQHLPYAEVWAYGSRVRGDHHDTSDLDLVVRTPEALAQPCHKLADVVEAFSQSNLPLMVQITDWARIPQAFHDEILVGYVVLKTAAGESLEGLANIRALL